MPRSFELSQYPASQQICAKNATEVKDVPTLKQYAYNLIRRRIERGGMQAGSRLSDDVLAKEIGISRGPIREAICQLIRDGLAEQQPRHGVFVRGLSRPEIEELFEVCQALESFAAAKAAMIATDGQITELERLHQESLVVMHECRDLPGQLATPELTDRFQAGDMQFHLNTVSAAGNQRLFDAVENCKALIRVFVHMPIYYDLQLMADSAQQHAAIIEAIRRRDSHAARDLTTAHIAMVNKRVL